jgi:hypothetical protein
MKLNTHVSSNGKQVPTRILRTNLGQHSYWPDSRSRRCCFELKPALINMVQASQFCGKAHKDANKNLQNFLEMCSTFTIKDVPSDGVLLLLFPFSLLGRAKQWFYSISHKVLFFLSTTPFWGGVYGLQNWCSRPKSWQKVSKREFLNSEPLSLRIAHMASLCLSFLNLKTRSRTKPNVSPLSTRKNTHAYRD